MSEPEEPLALLYRAFNTPLGIKVHTQDLERFRQRLYAARREDPDLQCISICVSPTNPATELWLVKKGIPNGTDPTEAA